MCGIVGILGPGAGRPELLAAMTRRLAHRGPDDEGLWADPAAGIALGHRRLSIVDLSPAGHEPMLSASGRLVISYNGEIYNHAAIRVELERNGEAPEGGWRGHSDVETFLQAIDCWGLERALGMAVGMFAFALWDRRDRSLRLVRDRFGEKPLYVGRAGRDLVFASELKALRLHPDFDDTIDRAALETFAARCYVPAPRSIFQSIRKLEPGCILTIADGFAAVGLDGAETDFAGCRGIELSRYYDYRSVVSEGERNLYGSKREALVALDGALSEAIDGQLLADVPVGAFLSGGIDSSTICAIYQRQSARPIHTFSVGFGEEGYNEAEHAKAVAGHLGTVHHELYVSVDEARDVIPSLPDMYDEPFADSSQIPTFLISKFARQSVTVALTGDGGDELFGGYNRYIYALKIWAAISRLPAPMRKLGTVPFAKIPASFWTNAAELLRRRPQPGIGYKVRKGLAIAGAARSLDETYATFLDEWAYRPDVVVGDGPTARTTRLEVADDLPQLSRVACYDALTYLPDDILCKVDRASMAVSLETRVPFLDHRVAAVAARTPAEWKVSGGVGKKILRDYLYRFVPQALVDRPKAGFGVPIAEWLRGPLRDWAESLLAPDRLRQQGYFEAATVGQRWQELQQGSDGAAYALWAILMFEAWLENDPRA